MAPNISPKSHDESTMYLGAPPPSNSGKCAMVKSRYIGDKLIPPLMTESLFHGPYKPLLTWVDEFIPYYMEIMGV